MPSVRIYKPEFCEQLIIHMSQGKSFETFGAKVNVTRKTLYKWVEKYKEFEEAKDIAFLKAMEFFESRLSAKVLGKEIKGLDLKSIDNSCLMFALKTRFHKMYGDRQQIDHTTGGEKLGLKVEFVKPSES